MLETAHLPKPERNELWTSVLFSLRMAIITGQLEPGTHLVEAQLAEKLGVSRGPIRDALMRLEQENLVAHSQRRGRFVLGLSPDDIHEIYSLRRLLETYGVELGLERLSGEYSDRMRELLDEMRTLAVESRFEELAPLDLEFHRSIVASAGNGRLVQMWNTQSSVSRGLIVVGATFAPDTMRLVIGTHEDILDAFAAGDLATAKEAVRGHLTSAEELVSRMLRESSPISKDTLGQGDLQ